MKLKFIDQEFQSDAVNAIADIFQGSEIKKSDFTIDKSKELEKQGLDLRGEGISYDRGFANKLSLDDFDLLKNVREIQERNNILKSDKIQGRNFSVEMETGTGKTYVYTKTILELNKRYGFTKFIIVVPSIAIKEGVYKSFQITEEHFKMKYDNTVYSYFVYDSSKLNRIQTFSTSTNIEIMIINIDAFRKTLSESHAGNIIHRESDRLSGNKPIDLISGTNPIVIIDEPQSVDNTPKAKEAIQTLKPLVTLRYSATHRQEYNLMYRLTPVDAYQQNLVKHIEVSSVQSDKITAKPYIKLLGVSDKDGYSARLEILKKKKDGSLKKETVKARPGDDLWELSDGVDYYENQNYRIEDIDCFENEESVTFAEGTVLHIGEGTGEVSAEAIKRAQIRETIDLHIQKEKHYLKKGIKVLSLFFIDKVDNYRQYTDDGHNLKGQYALWFEEEYEKLINGKYKHVKAEHERHFSCSVEDVHDGYFSKDRKGNFKDTSGVTQADDSTYELIMKDKERLLDLNVPLRFIFSHSALKEGWDNPNVFQVCTLVDTKDSMTKRQKIGRGLRICVDQEGNRVNDVKYNMLSVIANESYADFAQQLQTELEKEAGYKFGVVEQVSFADIEITADDGSEKRLSQEDSTKLYKYLKDNEFLNKQNKVTEKFHLAINDKTFKVPEEFEPFNHKIENRIKSLSRTIEIKNKDKRQTIKRNKEVFDSPEFRLAFDKIKEKTIYSVNIKIGNFIFNAIEGISNMPQVETEKIRRERSELNVTKSGVTHDMRIREQAIGSIYDFEKPTYPDLIRRVQDATSLTRKTILEILKGTHRVDRLKEFNLNPELFLKQVIDIVNNEKRKSMTEGLQYHKTGDYYVMTELFDADEVIGYRDQNVLKVSHNKHIFDFVVYDSGREETFAREAEVDDGVVLYAKIPSNFKIDTPFGSYNPDWLLVMQSEEEHKLYFVAETKGSSKDKDLRGTEKAKILSGRKHFEVLDTGVKYELITALRDLKK